MLPTSRVLSHLKLSKFDPPWGQGEPHHPNFAFPFFKVKAPCANPEDHPALRLEFSATSNATAPRNAKENETSKIWPAMGQEEPNRLNFVFPRARKQSIGSGCFPAEVPSN